MRFLGGFRDFVEEIRDPRPRLKPGVTYFRLLIFLTAAVALSIVLVNVATSKYPPQDECFAKGIDSGELKEGTCKDGDTTIVVVDRHSTLKLETLEAKLLTVRYRRVAKRGASGSAGDRLITFDISVKNLTEDSARVGEGSFVLNAGRPRSEDVAFEQHHEPHSFVARDPRARAMGTVEGTVTFRVPAVVARAVRKGGNLDVANLGEAVPVDEPRSLFSLPEHGVFRVYH